MQTSAQFLRQGKILLIHPEGTRSPNGQLLPFKQGIAILANHLQCPVVPVYIEGAHEFWPKGARFPKSRSDISVTIGRPLYPQALETDPNNIMTTAKADALTNQLMLAVAEISKTRVMRNSDASRA